MRYIILLGIISTIFMSVFEVLALIQGTLASQTSALTPWYIKGIKDLCFLMIVVYAVTPLLLGGKIFRQTAICAGFWLAGIIPSLLFSATVLPFPVLASGLRWALPMLLPALLFYKLDISYMVRITNALILLFLFHLLVQIYQLFFMGHWFGLNQWGFPSRLPGIFSIPNAAAFFNLSTLLFIDRFKSKKTFLFLAGLVSTFLTASGTGIITLLIFILFIIARRIDVVRKNMKLYMLLCVPFFMSLGLTYINFFLPSRGSGYVAISLGTRFSIFIDAFSSGIISTHMGLATNTGILFSNFLQLDSKTMIADNLYASILVNLGYWGLLFFGILIFIYFKPCFRKKTKKESNFYSFFLFLIAAFSFTTITFEVFPTNLLISIMIAFAHAPKHIHYQQGAS